LCWFSILSNDDKEGDDTEDNDKRRWW